MTEAVPRPGTPLSMGEQRLSGAAALAIQGAIRLAAGREVCFAGTVDASGRIVSARAVARGDSGCVLALPGFADAGEMLIHNHPSGNLEPSGADLEVAARLHDEGIGFAIVNNAATRIYVVVEVPRVKTLVPLDPDRIAADLAHGGPVAAAYRGFEDRPSQQTMASTIASLYNDGGIGLLEAGTGVGKSLGYLLPALRWAAANGERTVVSTNTINLQEQLVGKDLPFLERALRDQPVRFALLKGWRNYLCRVRLEQASESGTALFESSLEGELAALRDWAESTADGSLSSLPVQPRPEVWDEVAAEPDLCQRTKCAQFDRCFVFKARREAAAADVVVVNHHLLLSDIAVRRASRNWEEAAVLPPYKRLVIDEGHHLEDAAAAHLGVSVGRRGLARLLNRLDRKGKGVLNALSRRLGASQDLLSTASIELVQLRLLPSVDAARAKSSLLFDLLGAWLQQQGQPIVRLTDAFDEDPVWRNGLSRALDDTLDEIALIGHGLQMVRDRMEGSSGVDESAAPVLNETRAVIRRLENAADALRATLRPERRVDNVRWVEATGKDAAVSLSSVPLAIAPILRDDLFERLETVVVTSATLATRGSVSRLGILNGGEKESPEAFEFLVRRLGLDSDSLSPVTGVFPSPFDYPAQSLLLLPTDVPAPNEDGAEHLRHVIRILGDLVEAADGGIFVLFTSHRDVRWAAAALREARLDARWPLLVQGDDARNNLLARFREDGSSVLLGTASFWEGVDVPGRALRGLLIPKLPFRVPTEPLTAAHCEAIERGGGNAFSEYMLPHAALRLKQGFGRLIRSAADRGTVVIADSRVMTKRYGTELLGGLPPAQRASGTWASLIPRLRNFYGSAGTGR
jgi:ATP-dependent DNA helicase DinG